jgi:hypothetical protein
MCNRTTRPPRHAAVRLLERDASPVAAQSMEAHFELSTLEGAVAEVKMHALTGYTLVSYVGPGGQSGFGRPVPVFDSLHNLLLFISPGFVRKFNESLFEKLSGLAQQQR